MKTGHRWSEVAIVFITALSALTSFSFSDVSAAQKSLRDSYASDSTMLQFKAENHILGFAPDKAYLASMDHALNVQFLGTKGVMPTSDTNAPSSNTPAKASPLSKIVYQNLWEGISLTYVATQYGITKSTYDVAPGADVSNIRLHYNVPIEMKKDGSLEFKFDTGNVTESAPIAWQEINGKMQTVEVAFRIADGAVEFQVATYDRTQPLIIDPTYQWHAGFSAEFNGGKDKTGQAGSHTK